MFNRKHIISAILHWSLCINLLPLISSQVLNPSASNCLGAPCMYRGDCRDRSGLCGDGIDHCNEMSQWLPLCGGSANLEKPSLFEPSPSSTTTYQTTPKMPVMMPTIMTSPQEEPSTMSSGTSTQTTTLVEQPSSIIESAEGTKSAPPSTAWSAWVGGNKNDGNEEENSPTKSSTNETDWFNNVADSWGERFNSTEGDDEDDEDEDESFFDKIDFWNNNAAAQEEYAFSLNGMLILSSIMMIMIGYLV